MGSTDFDTHYRQRYGAGWDGLRAALLGPGKSMAYSLGLNEPYFLDTASVVAACLLPLPSSGEILDACAAPGGKTLVLASRLAPDSDATILANELSSERRRRLHAVLEKHLPEPTRARVTVSGFDAAAAGGRRSEHGRFSAILLDAPCSSERHVLADPRALSEWTPARIRSLAQRQWSLLSSAFLLLKAGGSLVYATCALSPEENDLVVGRLLKKYGKLVECCLPEPQLPAGMPELADFGKQAGQRTDYGLHFLPDRCDGAGPIYCSVLRKLPQE